jgi:hypothetical protein
VPVVPVLVPVPVPVAPVLVPVPVPVWAEADRAKGRVSKLRAKVPAKTNFGKLEGFMTMVFLIVKSCASLGNVKSSINT